LLVFLQIPLSCTAPYRAFVDALGNDKVGWVGRNIRQNDLDTPAKLRRFRVLGGRIPLAKAITLPGVTLFAAVVNDPVARAMAQWKEAIGDVNHPHHDAVHTFMMREIFEEKHPFAAAMSNLATRALTPLPTDGPLSAAGALETVRNRPFLVSDATHTRAFANVLGRMLDLPPGTLREAAFRPPPGSPARGELLRLIRAANTEDIALLKGLKDLAGPGRPLVNTLRDARRAARAPNPGAPRA